jgi:O-methyltransferase involved in polyketide biosynthesis
MYLTLEAIHATLATMAQCRPRTAVVLTYRPPASLTGTTAQIAATFAGLAAEMGEPFLSRFLPDEIARLLREQGLARSPTSGHTRRGPRTSRGNLISKSPEPSG